MLNMEAIWQRLANSSVAVHRSLSAHTEAAPWSYKDLPQPHEWGSTELTERVRRLTAVQLVVLHREWMQSNAMLLPSAEAMGPGSPAHDKVRRVEGSRARSPHKGGMLWEGAESDGGGPWVAGACLPSCIAVRHSEVRGGSN